MATSAHLRYGSTKTMYLSVYDEFQNGKFIVQTSTHKICRLALDYSHEQSNKYIKRLTEDWFSCLLELNFGWARNCSSVLIKFATFTFSDGKANTRHHGQAIYTITKCQHLNRMLLMSFTIHHWKAMESWLCKEVRIMYENILKSIFLAKELGIASWN